MNQSKVIEKLSAAQNAINKLLIEARNADLRVEVTVNKINCFPNDTAVAVGLEIFNSTPVFFSDGTP